MSKLRPTLWRTCRVPASKTRLQLLWALFKNDGLCVADLACLTGISEQNASNQLRALNARGLITPRRIGLQVFYHPEPNTEVEHAQTLLLALRDCCEKNMPFATIIRQATAFTHARRILIIKALTDGPASFGDLYEKTGIPSPSLAHHLKKLEARRFVRRGCGKYHQNTPGNSFGRMLCDYCERTWKDGKFMENPL